MLRTTPTALPEVLILEFEEHTESRGCWYTTFSKRELAKAGIDEDFVEENVYCPQKAGTLYGIHFQNHPMAQAKLLRCAKGSGLDFAVDLRKDSANYKRWVCVELSSANRKQVYIPKGFGHAFLSLEDNTSVVMWIDAYFDQRYRRGIAYNDPQINITYPIKSPILAQHDREAPLLKDSDCNL